MKNITENILNRMQYYCERSNEVFLDFHESKSSIEDTLTQLEQLNNLMWNDVHFMVEFITASLDKDKNKPQEIDKKREKELIEQIKQVDSLINSLTKKIVN